MRKHDWYDHALCIGLPTEWFFPEQGGEASYNNGKRVCAGCPVKAQCLSLAADYVATGDRYGLFGGQSPAERRRSRRSEPVRLLLK